VTIAAIIAWLLAQPGVRDIIEDSLHSLIADLLFRSNNDPVFKEKYLALSAQLSEATDLEAKREILVQIRALRTSPSPPVS
jgi:hypothetical protein